MNKPQDYVAPIEDAIAEAMQAPEPNTPKDELAQLREENAALKDKTLRALADFENLRRRTEKEIADASTYAVTKFARDMLNVADNLQRAIAASETDADVETRFKALFEGIELTEKELHSIFGRFGVNVIHAQGQKFDPNKHQAMFEVEDTTLPHGTVTQVIQAGFAIGERTLRPAMVGVSKGGAKA